MTSLTIALILMLAINGTAFVAGYIAGRVHASTRLAREIELRAAFQRCDELLDARARRCEGANVIEGPWAA